ncbi:4-(cytidine 5'-diphospho)-2-C-methyl-D-erythritol kinase [Desulfonatronum thiodismutans]|uniref:4-(cytidine 5'-diphospho)-2-C-methyl-D-erythritol kinase n=1 Tax=Desulfonatronum thiodismutans TaxID=159290 RepID=UPI0004ABEC1D|nr:4-(cytidine 5'-diphospho)-2-C-methyl-D-erythritol kinase [Desulfonatronum thiodismutans]
MSTHHCLPTRLLAGCKVNIFLEILGLRDDGYHDLATLFLPLPTPHDILTVTQGAPGTGLTLTCSEDAVPHEENILARCYEHFGGTTGFRPDVNVHLQKEIPMGAGLGGGSSDAAAFLRYLNNAAGAFRLNDADLISLAGDLGADVPFFLFNRPAWATGRGDRLTPIRLPLDGLTVVLACPRVHISTAWAYKAWDETCVGKTPPSFPLTPQIAPDMFPALPISVFHNSFELPVFTTHPQLRLVKEALLSCGASGAVMSGSGASLFAVFRAPAQAEKAAGRVREWDIPTYVYPL